MKKVSEKNNINKYYMIIGAVSIVTLIALLVFAISSNTRQCLVEKGTIEHTEILTGYILKNEQTIDKDNTKVLLPIISEGARTSKNDIIATYRSAEYSNYEQTLGEMDKEILERMQDLPVVYSSEVDAIENAICALVKDSMGETSYNKMQEYKQKINTNISKRANIIGQLSPDGAQIRELIDKRNKYEVEAKKSNDNILAPIGGIVSYTIDGLENALNCNSIENLDYNTIKQIVNDKQSIDNTQIKVVNNYEAYIILKVSLDNEQYIGEGYNYRLRLIEQDNYEFLAKLTKTKKTQDGIEVCFRVTNGIENIVGIREAEIEVVWDYYSGLLIPNEALNKYDNKDASYVTVIRNGEYENIPVLTKISNDSYSVVKNYTDEELQTLGIECKYDLELYDRIIIQTNK